MLDQNPDVHTAAESSNHFILALSASQRCGAHWSSHRYVRRTEHSHPGQTKRKHQRFNSAPCPGRLPVPQIWLFWTHCLQSILPAGVYIQPDSDRSVGCTDWRTNTAELSRPQKTTSVTFVIRRPWHRTWIWTIRSLGLAIRTSNSFNCLALGYQAGD